MTLPNVLKPTLILIVGPTAIGKTALALRLAQFFQTETLSVDSRQFYKEMSIGTAVPTSDELALVKHHFIHSHSIKEEINVGDFEKQALVTLERVFQHHQVCIGVGGSGLYIKALVEGFDELPQVHPSIRQQLNEILRKEGLLALQRQLQVVDPVYYNQVDIQNSQRLIRALEVCISSGKPFSYFRKAVTHKRFFNIIKIGLNTDRAVLYNNIEKRVDAMITQGLLEEVEKLLPYKNANPLRTVGYTELFDYLASKLTLEDAISAIKQNTRRFAKRQLTWFNKDDTITWFEPDQYDSILKTVLTVLNR